jgi:hypothetical protein
MPTLLHQLVPHEFVELAGGLLEAVQAAAKVTYVRGITRITKGLADVNALFDGSVKKHRVDVEVAWL